jgi:hypothetical protein
MKITKTVQHRVNMGPYESVLVGATVELEVPEGGTNEDTLDEVDQTIADAVEPELRKVRRIASDDSYIHDYNRRDR